MILRGVLKSFVLLCLLSLLSGCGTLWNFTCRLNPCVEPRPYIGTAFDGWYIYTICGGKTDGERVELPGYSFLLIPLLVVDMPISVATDTITVPYDTYYLINPRGQLHKAIREHSYKKVQELLKDGADPNAEFQFETPLILACREGDMKSIRLLIIYHADVNKFYFNETPFSVAYGHYAGDPKKAIQIMHILIENGAKVNEIEMERTILDDAIAVPAPKEVIDFLRSKGAKTAEELEAEKESKKK